MRSGRKLGILGAISVLVGSIAAASPQTIWRVNASKAIAFSSDAQLLLTGMQVRYSASGSLIRTFNTDYSNSGVSAAACSPDGKLAALGIRPSTATSFSFA